MGTPEFACHCLQSLCEAGLPVCAVVTVPDKPIGRGRKVQASPVKTYAEAQGLPVLQPEKLKDPDFLTALAAYRADLFIVVAFRMLPKAVWGMPPLGTFNLHASLLPRYRGAAPIQRAIWNGETETGITTFLLDEHMDTGALLMQERIPITPDDNAGSLHDKLMTAGGPMVVATAKGLLAGTLSGRPQTAATADTLPVAPKIFKEDCYLDWRLPADKLLLQVRALSPYPAAIALFSDPENGISIPFKIFDVKKTNNLLTSYQQGQFFTDGRHFLNIACGNGECIAIDTIQMPGKKTLTIEEFLRGFRFPETGRFVFPSEADRQTAR
ncbi:MAG: methionyl-tRNA formyltransferase [Bacteroidales bacterium]|nr:methionyl-tRNA formyltransferase [Bacteroidales bacterium]